MSEYRDDQSIFILVKAETRDATPGFYAPPEERESELKEFREGRGGSETAESTETLQRRSDSRAQRGDWIERDREERGIWDDTVPPRSVIPRVCRDSTRPRAAFNRN
jgi:hypothetical protein